MKTLSQRQPVVFNGSAGDIRPMSRRVLIDRLFKNMMSVGGLSVIIAVSAIW